MRKTKHLTRKVTVLGIFAVIVLQTFSGIVQFPYMNEGSLEKIQSPQMETPEVATPVEADWWNDSWSFRTLFEVNSTSLTRTDSLFEVWVDFTNILEDELSQLGKDFDFDSIRVVENDPETGDLIIHNESATQYPSSKYEVPYSTWKDHNYHPSANARVKISWVLHGTTAANENRSYNIYFDTMDNGPKEAPNYWAGTSQTYSGQDEGYANNNVIVDTLYSIKSSNSSLFIAGTQSSRPYYQGTIARQRYRTGSEYRYDQTIFDESQFYVVNGRQTISIGQLTYQDNKIVIPHAYNIPVAGSHMNITYEVFENSIFAKVTLSFWSEFGIAGPLDIRYYGDKDGENWHVDGNGNSYQGSLQTMGPYTSTTWTAGWGNTRTDLLGFVLESGQSHVTGNYDSYTLYGNPEVSTADSYDEMSFYVVSCPKGTTETAQPVEDLWEDLVNAPKSSYRYAALPRQASIYVTVLDHDGFPVPNAEVYLNASADWSNWNDTETTNSEGKCIFSNKQQGWYNFTTNLTSPTSNQKITVNSTDNVLFNDISNYFTINASVWRIIFDVKDIESRPLTSGWLSMNHSVGTSEHIVNTSLDGSGRAIFRWENISTLEYNWTLYYDSPGYNNGQPIILNQSSITQASHSQGVSTVVSISVNMTYANFTIKDQKGNTVRGVTVNIYNSSDETGPKDSLVNITDSDLDGEVNFYWRVPQYTLNYSLKVNSTNLFPNLNQSASGDYTLNYQNFTYTGETEKVVLLLTDVTKYLGKIISVNDEFMYPYWNESLVIQAVYQHDPDTGTFTYANPTWMRYTVKDQFQVPLGAGTTAMSPTSQTGRFQANIDMIQLGMIAGRTYSVLVETFEAGFSTISSLTYYLEVQEIPTQISADQSSFEARWGDVNSTDIQFDVAYDNEITLDYTVENAQNFDLNKYLPLIQNNWTLKQLDLNFTNIERTLPAAPYRFRVYDDSGRTIQIGDSGDQATSEYFFSIGLDKMDSDLDFYIEDSNVDAYNLTLKGHLQRDGVVIHQRMEKINGSSSVVRIDSPGNGWKIANLNLDISDRTGAPALFNFSLAGRSTEYLINDDHETYTDLDYFVDPEVDYIQIDFHNNTDVTFNANFTILFVPVTDQHFYAENDILKIQTYSYFNPLGYIGVEFEPDKDWDVVDYTLSWSNFLNHSAKVVPETHGLKLQYNGQTYTILNGEIDGSFQLVLSNPLDSPIFSYHILPDDGLQSYIYNLTITRRMRWTNIWGLNDASVSYYLFSNSSIDGETSPTLTDGQYSLTFDTSRLPNANDQILKVTGTLANYQGQTLDLTFDMEQIYTNINGTTLFNRNRKIYKTEAHNYTIEYTDIYNLLGGNPQGIEGALASFTVGFYSISDPNADNPAWTDSGDLIDTGNGLYVLDYDTEFLLEGIYKFTFSLQKDPDVYEHRSATLTIEVALIPTNFATKTTRTQSKVQRESAIFSFLLLDGRSYSATPFPGSETFIDIQFTSESEFDVSYFSWLNGTNNGYYNLTVDTRQITPGTYTMQVTFTRANYSTSSVEVSLTVSKFEPSLTLPTGVQSFEENDEGSFTITIGDGLKSMTFEAILIQWSIEGTEIGGIIDEISADGTYTISFSTSGLAPDRTYTVNLQVTVTVEGVQYTIAGTRTVNIQVRYQNILGIPRPYFYMMVIGIVVIVSAIAMYRYIAYARIPDIVKKINRTTSEIEKGKSVGEERIAPTPADFIVDTFADDWNVLGLDLETIMKGKRTVSLDGKEVPGKNDPGKDKKTTGGYA